MVSSPPFLDRETGRIDRSRILSEAIPLAELVGLIAVSALVPFGFTIILDDSGAGMIFALATRFVLAVGAGVVLLYIVTRAIQLSEE